MAKSQDSTRYRGKRVKRTQDDAPRAKTPRPAVEENDDTTVAVENHDEPAEPVAEAVQPPPPEPPAVREPEQASGLDAETHERYEKIKRGELHITDLQKMGHPRASRGRQERGHQRIRLPQEAGPHLQDHQGAHQQERPDVRRRASSRFCPMASASSAAPNTTTSPAPTTSTSAPRRSDASACAPATLSPGRSARPRSRRSTSPSCASKPSALKSPTRSPRRRSSRTSPRCIPRGGSFSKPRPTK